jgi:hypothetical protein
MRSLTAPTHSPIRTLTLGAAFVVAALSPTEPAFAQVTVEPGDRIRIHLTTADSVIEGRLVSFGDDGLVYRLSEGEERTVARAAVDSLEVGRRGSHWQTGLAVGGLTGALVLGIAVAASGEECTGRGCFGPSRGQAAAAAGLAGLLVGGLVGTVIGAVIPAERWEPAVRPWASAGDPGALGLGIRLTF